MLSLSTQHGLPFHVMTKPIGPICNLDCEYCFYLTKTNLYPAEKDFRMSDNVLEEYIKQYIAHQPGPVISFAWQGGEPTLMGLEFFQHIVELQQQYLPEGWHVENSLQTNGTLLDQEWCDFLREHSFLVGLSLDGPPEIHDVYRKDKQGRPSSPQALRGLELLKEHKVEFNVLCVVNNVNAKQPMEVYQFFLDHEVKYIQFIPLVEGSKEEGVSSRSVSGLEYGRFLTTIFNHWVRFDLGDIYVQLFEGIVGTEAGMGSSLCVFSPSCGRFLAMEHNGDIYACDHYVDPDHLLGNIMNQNMAEMVNSPEQQGFGKEKSTSLTEYCKQCPVLSYCYGGCPKNRVTVSPTNEEGHNHLCDGYRQFFRYVQPYSRVIVNKLQRKTAPPAIRQKMQEVYDTIWSGVGRNDLCPCQSGKKYKKCHQSYSLPRF